MSNISNPEEASAMMRQPGEITGKKENAEKLITALQSKFNSISSPEQRLRAAYLIWQKPYVTTGGDTFIHSMLHEAGFVNVFKVWLRYPIIKIEEKKPKSRK